jgi:hypothetical protein
MRSLSILLLALALSACHSREPAERHGHRGDPVFLPVIE